MGADFWIEVIRQAQEKEYESLFDKAVQKRDGFREKTKNWSAAQKEVEKYYELLWSDGCFRDPYNATALLKWLKGVSWDKIESFLSGNEITGENLKNFRRMVTSAEIVIPTQGRLDQLKIPCSVRKWRLSLLKRRKQLLRLLDNAIAMNAPIQTSF